MSERYGADRREVPGTRREFSGIALALLERVFAKGWGKRDWVEHDPDYDILRDDPRFKKLLARLK